MRESAYAYACHLFMLKDRSNMQDYFGRVKDSFSIEIVQNYLLNIGPRCPQT